MMNLKEQLDKNTEDVGLIRDYLQMKDKQTKERFFKIPFGIRFKSGREKKKGKILALWLRNNHTAQFIYASIDGGLIIVETKAGKKSYNYDNTAIYFYKRIPLVVIFEWRLVPAGGVIESFQNRVLGGEDSAKLSEEMGINAYAQETIIRGVEKTEIEKLDKKKGKFGFVWILLIGGVVVFVILKLLKIV